ncbi:hypothetical protein BpHYR1_031863 [Brachionus plicatilis]|uniref:Uncharacterized protein n=1 Tax=Brachionus plicatilis TaxID=10195 RepID=A0A3M7SH81_BRAPC|nr:hypothetical protein BpHYR1_031863 [Brachionus plicatilis]
MITLTVYVSILKGIVPLGSSERRRTFFSVSLYIEDFDLSKTVLNFCCDSFGLLESTLCINPVLHFFILYKYVTIRYQTTVYNALRTSL